MGIGNTGKKIGKIYSVQGFSTKERGGGLGLSLVSRIIR